MPRPAGVRNHDFAEKRRALLEILTEFALNDDLRRPSLRQFAIAAGASEPTLRHYFGDRRGMVISILEHIHARGITLWDVIATGAKDPATSVAEYLRVTEAGMTHGGFIRAHAFGLIEGMADEEIGRAYLENLLDPALNAVVRKLEATPGAPNPGEGGRAAAFLMLAPILVMTLHQQLLGGKESSPMDVQTFMGSMERWLSHGLGSSETDT
ncbi:MAG: TetR/AcrR family transcriptional regulator [Pseudomonadota bacterium]